MMLLYIKRNQKRFVTEEAGNKTNFISAYYLKPIEEDEYSSEEAEKLVLLLFGCELCSVAAGLDEDVAGTPVGFFFT